MKQIAQSVSPASNEGRNMYVVNQITAALLELMESHPLEDISISRICDRAQVGRASFYRNFDSKEDVIRKHLKALSDSWARKNEGIDQSLLVESMFSYYGEHKDLFILLYKQGLAYLSLQNIVDTLGPKPEQSNIVAYSSAFLSFGIYGWIEEWFRRGFQETPKEMAELCLKAQRGELT